MIKDVCLSVCLCASVCVTYDKYLQPEQSERVLVDGDDSSVEENPLRLRSNRPQVGRDEERSRQNGPERHLEQYCCWLTLKPYPPINSYTININSTQQYNTGLSF